MSLPYNPRQKTRRWPHRETSNQLSFRSDDISDVFPHHLIDWCSCRPSEGRKADLVTCGREVHCFISSGNTTVELDGIREFDQPDEYYRDPRDPC